MFGQSWLTAWALASIHRPQARMLFIAAVSLGGTALFVSHIVWEADPWLKLPSTFAFLFVCVWLVGKAGFLRNLMSLAVVAIATLLCDFIVMFSMQSIQTEQLRLVVELGNPDYMLLKFLTALLMAAALPLVAVLWRVFIDKLPVPALHMFVLVPVSQLFAITVIAASYTMNDLRTEGYAMTVIMLLIFVLADIGLLYAMRQTRRNEELQHENRRINDQLRMQFEHYRQLAANADRLQKLRHDMINYLETIRSFMPDPAGHPAGELILRYSGELADSKLFYYCRNKIVDAVLVNKHELARSQNVDLELAIEWPASAPYDDLDLCSLFANMLDNAVAAAGDASLPADERRVRLDCYSRGGFFVVRCRNAKVHDIRANAEGLIMSTKRDRPDEHGIGLRNLGDIAAKYGGELKTEYGKRYFQTTVYLAEGAG